MAVQRSASGSIAEDLFIELFSEAFGAEKAGYLYSQYHFCDIYQNSWYADFLLESNGRRIAIEIDEEATKDLNHGSELGWPVCNTPMDYVRLVFCGKIEGYLRRVAGPYMK